LGEFVGALVTWLSGVKETRFAAPISNFFFHRAASDMSASAVLPGLRLIFRDFHQGCGFGAEAAQVFILWLVLLHPLEVRLSLGGLSFCRATVMMSRSPMAVPFKPPAFECICLVGHPAKECHDWPITMRYPAAV
jgi:hypothetical protein